MTVTMTDNIEQARAWATHWWHCNRGSNEKWLNTIYNSYSEYLADQGDPWPEDELYEDRISLPMPELNEITENLSDFYKQWLPVRHGPISI